MNKECRDKLEEIKKQSYKLFLHNLLAKEERARMLVRKIQYKYLTFKEENVAMKNEEAMRIITIVKVAKKIGEEAGRKKLKELQKAGNKWEVVNSSDNRVVGHLLDVCGIAWLSVPGRGKIVSAFKKIGTYDARDQSYVIKGMRLWKGHPTGYTLSMISTGRQEMSVNEVAVQRACEYINANDVECNWKSVID